MPTPEIQYIFDENYEACREALIASGLDLEAAEYRAVAHAVEVVYKTAWNEGYEACVYANEGAQWSK